MGGCIGSRIEICGTSGIPIPMVLRLHQSNGFLKRKPRVWRVQKCFALVGADTVLTSAWLQTTPCHEGYYRVQNGNMRNFGPINPRGTAFAPKQWLYQKKATDMDSSKMYCTSRCRCRTYQCVPAKYPMSWVGSIGSRMEICGISGISILMLPCLHQSNGYIKRKLRAWRVQKCNAIVGTNTVLTSAWPLSTPCHWG